VGRAYNLGSYRYRFNGKENDNEIKGKGNQQDYGMRVHDPRLGEFLSVDPLTKSYPWNSTYAFAENDVIRNVDLDGLEKYRIVGRSFAPRGVFGWAQFAPKADNRTKFQVADYLKVSARIHTQVTADLDAWTTEKKIFSQPSTDRFGNKWRVTDQGISVSAEGNRSKKDMHITGAYFARNGMEIGPPIDIQFDIGVKRDGNVLDVNTVLTGNVFPAQETLIFDAKGVGVFLGTSMANGGSLTDVWGKGKENKLSSIHTKIQIDDDGNFKGVYTNENGKEVLKSIDEYNAGFTNKKV